MVALVFFLCLIFIFPLFLQITLVIDFNSKKLYFSAALFNKITLFSGYAKKRKNGGIYLHFKNKTYVIIVNFFDNIESEINFFKHLSFFNCFLTANVSSKNVNNFYYLSVINTFINKILAVYKYKVFNFEYKTNLNFYLDDTNYNNVILSAGLVINVFSIIIEIIANYISVSHGRKGENNGKKALKQSV